MVKISWSSPPIALPSSRVSSSTPISASRGTESLGFDPAWLVAHRHQERGGRLDERGRPADEHGRRLVSLPPDILQHLGVDAPGEAHPPRGLLTSQRVMDVEPVT